MMRTTTSNSFLNNKFTNTDLHVLRLGFDIRQGNGCSKPTFHEVEQY